jgi:hypothetical protein
MIIDVSLQGIAALLAGNVESVQIELPEDCAVLGDVLYARGERFGERFSRMSADHTKRVVKLLTTRGDETLLYDSPVSNGDSLIMTLAALGG